MLNNGNIKTMSNSASLQSKKSFWKEVEYLLYLPNEYDSDKKQMWPLLVFLHGSGERGDNLDVVKLHGPPKLIDAGVKMPFIVVSPQLSNDERWSPDLMAWLIKDLSDTMRVDADCVYLTGLSMGGNGTWETAAKYPELFAAVAPICGLSDPSTAWKLRHVPTWIFHGAKDPVVPVKHSDDMYKALKQYGNVKYTVYPEAEHDSYTETYLKEDLYSWLLSQRRFKYTEKPAPKELETFVGRYTSKGNSAEVYLKEGILRITLATSVNKDMQLKHYSIDSFFFTDTGIHEVNFVPDKNRGYSAMRVYERQYLTLKRVQ